MIKQFNLNHWLERSEYWLLVQRANHATRNANKAVNRYKKKAGIK